MNAAGLPSQLWVLAPVVVWAAILLGLMRKGRGGSEAFLQSLMLWAGLVWAMSNVLSFADAFTPMVLRLVWATAAGVAAVLILRWRTGLAMPRPARFEGIERGMLVLALLLCGFALLRAWVSAPNTVDVLNYHLPRQIWWLQNGNLAHYATINARENIMPPLAEVIGAQFLGLTGSDRWANLPQAISYAALALAVALLARRLGAGRKASLAAGVMTLLIPMAHHEASGAKNDLMAALWTVQAALAVERMRRMLAEGRTVIGEGLWLGLAVALAWLTKSTAMLFLPPLILAGLAGGLRGTGCKALLRGGAAALGVWLLAVAPFHGRNLMGAGSLLGEHRAEDGGAQVNEAMSPALLGSNLLRHATLHLLGPSETANAAWMRWVKAYHDATGLGLSDRRITLWTTEFAPAYAPQVETLAGAPVHFVLILGVVAAAIMGVGAAPIRRARWLVWAVAGGGVLFCLVLKWQPWATRLELPLFALGMVPAALGWSGSLRANIGAGLLGCAAVFFWWQGADTEGRNLWRGSTLWGKSRQAAYYAKLPQLEERDAMLAKLIEESGARRVQLVNLHDIAYPLMRRLLVQRPDTRFVDGGGRPDVLVVLNRGDSLPLYRPGEAGRVWRLAGEGYGEGVYLPEERVSALGWWKRLPRYAGFSAEEGFQGIDYSAGGGRSEQGRSLGGGTSTLRFLGRGAPMTFLIELVPLGPAAGTVSLYLDVDDEPWRRIEVGGGGSPTSAQLKLPTGAGWHRLQLRCGPGAPELLVLRLVINDSPPERAR
ncbi:MAG: hypothetical protein RIQ79_33 [Verrucomicrobiota bacterium]